MKRWIWILCGVLLFGLMGENGTEIENLKPVQLLEISRENGRILLQTDTGDRGRGRNLQEALEDLQASSDGRIFLETADLLLVRKNTEDLLNHLDSILRPAVRICITESQVDLQKAAKFLSCHRPERTLGEYRTGRKSLNRLLLKEGKMYLEGIGRKTA